MFIDQTVMFIGKFHLANKVKVACILRVCKQMNNKKQDLTYEAEC